jgi:hypothetical protein
LQDAVETGEGVAPAGEARNLALGRSRVAVRPHYGGLPSMAGRGADEGGESLPDRGPQGPLVRAIPSTFCWGRLPLPLAEGNESEPRRRGASGPLRGETTTSDETAPREGERMMALGPCFRGDERDIAEAVK